MDNSSLEARFTQGAQKLGLTLPADAAERLLAWQTELFKWNARVNLTAIRDPEEAVEKHLLDSLAVLPDLLPLLSEERGRGEESASLAPSPAPQPVPPATDLLDLGAGAGLPGIPLAVALPTLTATLVDAVEKKVSFMKTGAVKAGVAGRVKALHARAEGHPSQERLPLARVVISRAFLDVGPFLQLARPYLLPGGHVVAMLGRTPPEAALRLLAQAAGFQLTSVRSYPLPFSGDPRGVAVFHVEQP